MIRINLLPPEIAQGRRDEQMWKWVWLSGAALVLLLTLFWGTMFLRVNAAAYDVAVAQQDAANVESQAARFQIFREKESDLSVRLAAYGAAGAGKLDWARLLNELGLVLPTDVYLTTLTGTEAAASGGAAGSSVSLSGKAVDHPTSSVDSRYKSVAKMLVRLTEMEQFESVWLTDTNIAAATGPEVPMISWSVTAKISPSAAQTTTASY